MEFFLIIILLFGSLATVLAIFTNAIFWVALGLLGTLIASCFLASFATRNDHSGDAGLAYLFAIIIPLGMGTAIMFLAALVRWIILHVRII